PVVAERAGESLREVGGVREPLERPGSVAERHLVDARDPARVEVVLEQYPAAGVEADDRDAVRRGRVVDLPSLYEELLSWQPLEGRSSAWRVGGIRRERTDHVPLPDEDVEGL